MGTCTKPNPSMGKWRKHELLSIDLMFSRTRENPINRWPDEPIPLPAFELL